VLRTIVEGEPGVFPEPVARLMRGIGGLFRRRPADDRRADPPPGPAPDPSGFDPSTLDPARPAEDRGGDDDAPGDADRGGDDTGGDRGPDGDGQSGAAR
jgi:hypothetical protein